jgi:hypothetical protein
MDISYSENKKLKFEDTIGFKVFSDDLSKIEIRNGSLQND